MLRSDNGGEYTGNNFKDYCKSQGIQQEFTARYLPQGNGVAERFYRTLCAMVRCSLIHSKLGHSLWAGCLMSANYVHNRLPTVSL